MLLNIYLGRKNLSWKKLLFILSIVKDTSLYTNDEICLILKNNYKLYEEILKYKFYGFISELKMISENKIAFTDERIKRVFL